MLDAPGVGLAAPQIGVSLRVFCLDVSGHPKAVSCHGDLKYDQFLRYRRKYILIDFEMFCRG